MLLHGVLVCWLTFEVREAVCQLHPAAAVNVSAATQVAGTVAELYGTNHATTSYYQRSLPSY